LAFPRHSQGHAGHATCVAATAIARNLTLKTRDEHFQRLEELGLRRAEA
jgi:predicted nucleic acid-binding protein